MTESTTTTCLHCELLEFLKEAGDEAGFQHVIESLVHVIGDVVFSQDKKDRMKAMAIALNEFNEMTFAMMTERYHESQDPTHVTINNNPPTNSRQ